ncbi:TetR/AcrR family transcriptional regulator [Streptomyces geranii]|uniref:TetR/AcrR family transcriptional regulator n=1 Tax=Streptomyces geranii TaxID=2058923 RepID=UPI000D02B3FB|nr:TetR/AcrR family transcriptional regulator [Streptomyces geranii]
MATESGAASQSLAEEYHQAARRRLDDAARSVFAAKGYLRASISEIAAEAGVSRSTLYAYYKTKADLMRAITAVLAEECADAMGRLGDILVDGTQDDMHAWLDESAGWYERHRSLALAAQEANLSTEGGARDEDVVRRLIDAAGRWVETWPPERRAEARLRLELCRLQLHHYLWGFAPLMVGDEVDVVEILADMWWRELRPVGE